MHIQGSEDTQNAWARSRRRGLASQPAARHRSQTTDPTDRVSRKPLLTPLLSHFFWDRTSTRSISHRSSNWSPMWNRTWRCPIWPDWTSEMSDVIHLISNINSTKGNERCLRDTRSVGSVVWLLWRMAGSGAKAPALAARPVAGLFPQKAFLRRIPVKIRHPMRLRHPVASFLDSLPPATPNSSSKACFPFWYSQKS